MTTKITTIHIIETTLDDKDVAQNKFPKKFGEMKYDEILSWCYENYSGLANYFKSAEKVKNYIYMKLQTDKDLDERTLARHIVNDMIMKKGKKKGRTWTVAGMRRAMRKGQRVPIF
jgi:hypothetical protein